MRGDEPDAFDWVPISSFTVCRERGHTTDALVREIYAHLGIVQHRSETVEYRVEQHRERLRKRLIALDSLCSRFGTVLSTAPTNCQE